MGETFWICEPCRNATVPGAEAHHQECAGTEKKPCDCLVCAGERIGDQVMGDSGGNMPKRKR